MKRLKHQLAPHSMSHAFMGSGEGEGQIIIALCCDLEPLYSFYGPGEVDESAFEIREIYCDWGAAWDEDGNKYTGEGISRADL